MSDSGKGASPAAEAPKFSDRELQLLGWAMQSLKSGPPEIDYEKLAAFAGMSNPRSASNAWAKIRVKLIAPDGAEPTAPKKATGGKKKTDTADVETPPKKKPATPRKRGAKQQDVDGESSPKKKGRGKKAVVDDAPEVKKEEVDGSAEPAETGDAPSTPVHAKVEDEDEDEAEAEV